MARRAAPRRTMLLVIDDLALELPDHPIHIPIPQSVLDRGEPELRRFTLEVLKKLMALPYFTWTHPVKNVVIDGFMLRHTKLYPSFST